MAIKEEIKEEEIGLEVTRRMEVSSSVAQAPTASSLAAEEDVKPVIKGEHRFDFVTFPILLLIKSIIG